MINVLVFCEKLHESRVYYWMLVWYRVKSSHLSRHLRKSTVILSDQVHDAIADVEITDNDLEFVF